MSRQRQFRWRLVSVPAAVIGVLLSLAPAAVAWPGSQALDRSFGEDGVSLTTPSGNVTGEAALALTEDGHGRLIVAGTTDSENIMVRRFRPGGSPDLSFDGNGKVETSLAGASAQAVTMVPGGDILVAGGTETGLALVRYHSDGSRVRSFGHDGHVVTPGGSEGASALDVGIQRTGRIVSVGYKVDLSGDWTGMVIGYRPDGSIDPNFADHGTAELHSAAGVEVAISGVEILPDGKIMLGGDVGGRLLLSRLLADGRPDRGFGGGDGIVLVDADRALGCRCSFANALTIAPGGKPVLAGVAVGPGPESSLLARFTPGGRLDRSFGNHGVVRTRRGSRLVFNDVTTEADGGVTATGFYNLRRSGEAQVAALRYRSDGELDRRFADGGFFSHGFGLESIGYAALTQPSGRVLVAGRARFERLDPESPLAVEGGDVLMLRFKYE